MEAKRTFVIIGAGLAGATAAATLRKEGFAGRIVLIGEEPERPYERPPLSKDYLRGETARDGLFVRGPTYYEDNAIELWTSVGATAVYPRNHEVVLGNGERLRYDRLLLATGALPRRLGIPGADLAGIHYLRTAQDSEAIRQAVQESGRVVVIGGGWIGAEVAASIRQIGRPVALITPGSVPLERVLGVEVGTVYRDLHAEHGVELHLKQRVAAFVGRRAVEAVETTGGTRIEGDLVIVGAGAEPSVELAVAAGLAVDDGILVNANLETSVAGIFAAGDVASAWHPLFGARLRVEHWDNARRQGSVAARNMLDRRAPYDRIPYFYSDQYELGMEYAGYAPTWDRVVFRGNPAHREFIAFWLQQDRVVAGLNANIWQVNEAIGRIVASGRPVDVRRLADPAVDLEDVERLWLPLTSGTPTAAVQA